MKGGEPVRGDSCVMQEAAVAGEDGESVEGGRLHALVRAAVRGRLGKITIELKRELFLDRGVVRRQRGRQSAHLLHGVGRGIHLHHGCGGDLRAFGHGGSRA